MTSSSGEPTAEAERGQSSANRVLEQRAGLVDAPDDVHYLIASELTKTSSSAVLALGQSCVSLREAMLPFIYRKLVLKKGLKNSQTDRAYQALIANFQNDANCNVAQHVRCIVVKDDVPEEDLLLIFDKISECSTLHELR
jgi:hypothetical protein